MVPAFNLAELLSEISFHLLGVHKGPRMVEVIETSRFRRGQKPIQNTAKVYQRIKHQRHQSPFYTITNRLNAKTYGA